MNSQVAHVKFMIEGINENVVARVDMDMQKITKAELDEALNALLSSLYMMVRALHLVFRSQYYISSCVKV